MLTTMKTNSLKALAIITLFFLTACSESDQSTGYQSAGNSISASADKSNVDTNVDSEVYASNLPAANESVEIDVVGDSYNQDTNFELVDSVTNQLELESEQKSVAELEQSTEAANQELQNTAEQKTVNEARSLAAEQAASLTPGKEDVATPLAQSSLVAEPVAEPSVGSSIEPSAGSSLEPSAGSSSAPAPEPLTKTAELETAEEQPFISSSGLRTFDPIRGGWTKKSQKIAGEWLIETRDGQAYLVLGDDFKTRNAPDLKFVLSNTSVDEVSNRNAMDGALFVANLESPSGEQVYLLPENFYEYSTLLLHCEKYTKLWGAAAINR